MDEFFTVESLTAIKKAIDAGRANPNKTSAEILADAVLAFVELFVEQEIAQQEQLTPQPVARENR